MLYRRTQRKHSYSHSSNISSDSYGMLPPFDAALVAAAAPRRCLTLQVQVKQSEQRLVTLLAHNLCHVLLLVALPLQL